MEIAQLAEPILLLASDRYLTNKSYISCKLVIGRIDLYSRSIYCYMGVQYTSFEQILY